MTILCIIPGPSRELARRPDARARWCFACRAHLVHDVVVYCDLEPSYYDPVAVLECPRCHRDQTTFPS